MTCCAAVPPRVALVLAAVLAAATPARAAGLDEAQVRAFGARQQAAWNGRAVDGYFQLFEPGAVFIDQYRTPSGQIVPYGRSSLAQARVQTRRFLAASKATETGQVERIVVALDGRSASVASRTVSRIVTAGKLRTVCAERTQTLRLQAGRLRSAGQTDTLTPCPR